MLKLLKPYQIRVSKALDRLLPLESTKPERLHQAIRYMVLNDSSKRVRSSLVYIVGDELSGDPEMLDITASSVEMFHIFSLIHDDLPCVDNSDLRHHRPSCHKAFDESTALLAGDALLILGIDVINKIASKLKRPEEASALIGILCEALLRLVKGEQMDIENTNSISELSQLQDIYNKKTTALITAAVHAGAIAAGCKDAKIIESLKNFGDAIGLAFQIVDDIIDVESDTETLGKPQGNDQGFNKVTYPSFIGLQESKDLAQKLYDQALKNLDQTGFEFAKLRELAEFIVKRNF